MSIIIPTNKYQTPITSELLDSLNTEVREQFMDYVTNVLFIKRLISPDRKLIKDCPKDENGRAIIDLANPPILTNVDYFTQTRDFFLKEGCYTHLRPNANPNSEYGVWLRRERNRCWNGMVRKSDGAWITGLMYWYLNYMPMMINERVEGTNYANRIEGFPDVWEGIFWRYHYLHQARFGGIYNNFKGGQHASELSRRGCSKSYTLASMMSHNLVMGESMTAHKRFVTILTAYLKEYLAEKDGTMSKFLPILDHCATYTQFPRRKIIDSPNKMAWQMGYRDSETNAIKGSRNSVAGVACKDDSDKLRGKRGYILFEEFGSFKNLTEIYNTVRDSVEEAGVAFAMMYLVGTSGNKKSDFEGAKELVYSPSGYNIYGLPNVFDRGDGNSKFSFFFPSYINRKGFYNKDGISDVVGALINILQYRHHTKYNTKDPNTIIRVIAEQPITPSEAILRVRRSIFPTTEINERLSELMAKESLLNDVYVGKLVQDNTGEIKYEPTQDKPIRSYPLKGSKYNGAIEIYSMPQKDSQGRVVEDRYCAGFDPVDFESADSVSLASIFIIDLWTDEIAAEYTGRQDFAENNYEILRKLCLFYNCKCLYEQNLKGTYSYFSKMNCLYLLAETPEYLKDKDIVKKIGYGNTSRGVTATKPVNDYANTLVRNWLLLPKTRIEKNQEGKEVEITVPNVSTIKNIALLQELSQYSPEINCDRIRALGLAMLYREEFQIRYNGNIQEQQTTEEYTASSDDFFKRNGFIH
jgi:hypothetical protein